LSLGYPQPDEERAILRRYRADDPMEDLAPVLSAEDIVGLAARAREVFVHAAVEGYIVDLVNATRTSEALALGASPRATLALYHAAQALAALRGRDYVLPDDVLDLTEAVLAHRLIPGARMRLHGEGVVGVLRALVADVPVPVEENWAGRGAG
jgi:MoxR-like ATPase